jgi:hypothetical protein
MKKNKLLIITSKDDAHADFFINELNSRKRSDQVIRLNTEDFAKNCVSTFNGESIQVKVIDSGLSFDSGELLSVWYRRPETISTSHVMDKEAAKQKILQFTNSQGLFYSAIDLVYSENNEYYFLENNPNGQFLWLQLRTGVDLIARMRKAFLNH